MTEQNTHSPSNNHLIELQLIGIDKKWVRHNGKWVDKTTLNQPKKTITVPDSSELGDNDNTSSSPWWKFWKR